MLGKSRRCELRGFAISITLSAIAISTAHAAEGDRWGGSVGLTSDYLVRGVSRSNNQAALQLDVHYLDASGFVAGLFASNTQVNSNWPTSVELDAFIGYAWSSDRNWQGRALFSHYAYPWSKAYSSYDYNEFNLDLSYQGWLDVRLMVSPDAPIFSPYRGLIGVTSGSAELSVQHRVAGELSATAGAGYAYYEGQEPTGYSYWSVGAAYNLAPFTFVLSYVNTNAAAKALFYNAAADNRWSGTVLWRF
jgi:uncharacterized protein (TIGR02001 family)